METVVFNVNEGCPNCSQAEYLNFQALTKNQGYLTCKFCNNNVRLLTNFSVFRYHVTIKEIT